MVNTVRPFEPDDKDDVLRICEKVWGSETRYVIASLWDWKHGRDDSAVDKERQASLTVLKEGRIAGFGGMIPAQFMIDGKVEYGGAILDTYIDPDARGAGVKLMKRQIDESGICYGVAIPRLRELCARILKRDDINLRIIEKRYLFLDPTFVLSRKLPRLIARGLALAWKLYTSVRWHLLAPKMPEGCSIKEALHFTKDIDKVWARFARQFRFSMTRDAGYLNWRFGSGPFTYQKRILLRREEIVGCIIFRKAIFNGEPVVLICEAFATGESRLDYLLLLGDVYRYAIENRATRIGTMNTGCAYFKDALDKMGFLSRVHESMPVIGSWVGNSNERSKIYNQMGWYISPADADIEHTLFDQMSRQALKYAKDNVATAI